MLSPEYTLITPEQDNPYLQNVAHAVRDFNEYKADPAAFALAHEGEIRDNFARLAEVSHGPKVEVIIPTKDDIPSFGLLQLARQAGCAPMGVTVLENGMSDPKAIEHTEMFHDVPGVRIVRVEQPLGINGGKAYGVMKVADRANDFMATVDADSGPVSPWWLYAGLQGFTSPSIGALYGPIVFPELRMVPHKMITLPAQFVLSKTQGYVNTIGPNTFFRREAIQRPIQTWQLDDQVDRNGGNIRAIYDQYSEDALLGIVRDGGYQGRNIFDPRSVVLTSGRRIPPDYLLISASRFVPVQRVRDWGNKRIEEMYK